jgi:outer membrane PBP1 activator LpoA protein
LHISKNGLALRPINSKRKSMKKLFAIVVVAVAMTACNNSAESTASQIDSTAKAAADSVKAAVDTAAAKVDSAISTTADSAKAKIGAVVDSAKKAIKK